MEGKRIGYIDLAKGICMLLVVLGHFQELYGSRLFQDLSYTLSYIRLPLYFFLSGMFFRTYASFRYFLTKKINHLLVPYLVFLVLGLFTVRNFPIWFLSCLFYSNMLFYCCKRIEALWPGRYVLAASCMVLSVIGFFLPDGRGCDGQLYEQVYYFGTAMTCLGFFYAGYAVNRYTGIVRSGVSSRIEYELLLMAVCAAVVAFVGWYYDYADTGFRLNFYGYSIVGMYAAGLAGCIGILVLSRRLRYLPYVSFIGRYSIVVLLTHYPLMYYVDRLITDSAWLAIPLVLAAEVPVILVARRYFPYIFAQKELIPLDR